MRSARSSRGYSLIELVVALGVSMIVIAGALTLTVAQQRTFQSTSRDRALQESARVALGSISTTLRYAGLGVDPALAFDLGPQTKARLDRMGSTKYVVAATRKGDGSACAGLCRDSTTGPDEIVFYSRDPAFGPHPLTVAAGSTSTSLSVALVPGQTSLALQKGQVLQVACYTGNQTWAYVTVSGAPTINGDGTATIPITNSGSSSFPNQTALLADACFTAVASMVSGAVNMNTMDMATKVFKVDRYHYYILSYDASGAVRPWGTAGARPYLMLDQGLSDNVTSQAITTVVAPDVEDLQFAYVFPNDAVTPVVGASAGTALTNNDAGINLAPADPGAPAYSDPVLPTLSATRLTHHPGNIGAVRVSVVVRSSTYDPALTDGTIPAAGNRAATAGASGYARMLLQTSVRVPNLFDQVPYYPSYGAAGTRLLNVGGG